MDAITRLAELFKKFPGIGARQAKRFVYFLLSARPAFRAELVQALTSLSDDILQCSDCRRFFTQATTKGSTCRLCSNPERDDALVMIVEKDTDLETVEDSGLFKGRYFVLGGRVPVLAEKPASHVRLTELLARLRQKEVKEIILALSATAEGESTAQFVKEKIASDTTLAKLALSHLGRGLSTGTELEYSDPETIRSALENRK